MTNANKKATVVEDEHLDEDENVVGKISADNIIPATREFLDGVEANGGDFNGAITVMVKVDKNGLLDDLEVTTSGCEDPRVALSIIAATTHGCMSQTMKALCANEQYGLAMDVVSEVANATYTGLVAAVPERDRDVLEEMADKLMKKNKKGK